MAVVHEVGNGKTPRPRKRASTAAQVGAATKNGIGAKSGRHRRADDPQVVPQAELERLLVALEAARDGEFQAPPPRTRQRDRRRPEPRLQRARRTGASAFSKEVVRVGRVIGREGRLTERAASPGLVGALADTVHGAQHTDRRPRPADHRGRARHRRRRRRRPLAEDAAHDRGAARQGRVPPHRHDRERDGRPALVLRRRGDARRARGRHRRQARRPGEGARASPASGRT